MGRFSHTFLLCSSRAVIERLHSFAPGILIPEGGAADDGGETQKEKHRKAMLFFLVPRPGFEPGTPCLKAGALPTELTKRRYEGSGKRCYSLAGMAGFEPANEGVKVPCLTAWLHPYWEERAGIKSHPSLFVGWVKGLEPSTPGTTIRCSNQLSYTHHIYIRLGSR